LLSIDELNKLNSEMFSELRKFTPSEIMGKKESLCDWVEDYLMFLWSTGSKEDGSKVVNKEIAGETFRDRVYKHAELGDTEAIIKVISTDGHRVWGNANYEEAKRQGKTTKIWHTMLDDRVRDPHQYLEGISVGIDEEFYTYNGDHALFPSQFGVAEEDCNCRCWVEYK